MAIHKPLWTPGSVPVWPADWPPVREAGDPPPMYLFVTYDEYRAIMRRRERVLNREIRAMAPR